MAGIKYILILIGAMTLLSLCSMAQAPNIRCLAVDSVGNVGITWVQPTDSCGVFTNYLIYYSTTPGGPYALIDSVTNFNTTSYIHLGASADLASAYYYVVSNSGCVVNISDTLQSIFLTVANSAAGLANLSWNSLHTPELTTIDSLYFIYREDTLTGIMNLIDSVSQNNAYPDAITVCSDTINYQIFIVDSSGCISSSSVAQLAPDGLQPNGVTIDSVSVNPGTGLGSVSWTASGSSDVVGYNIYVADTPPFWTLVGYVSGAGSTFYSDPFFRPHCISRTTCTSILCGFKLGYLQRSGG